MQVRKASEVQHQLYRDMVALRARLQRREGSPTHMVIPDLHGEADLFEWMLEAARRADKVILLGDLFDDGPDPEGVFNTVHRLYIRGGVIGSECTEIISPLEHREMLVRDVNEMIELYKKWGWGE